MVKWIFTETRIHINEKKSKLMILQLLQKNPFLKLTLCNVKKG